MTMTQHTSLSLSIHADELNKFCEKLLKRSRDISKTHDALSTLEAFITVFSNTSNHPEACKTIENILHTFSEKTRQALLTEKTAALIDALEQLDIAKLAAIHCHLSRNGFYQILTMATQQIEQKQLSNLKHWCHHWINKAKQAAEQASGYPEAYDFHQAGIDIKQFQAMKDVDHFINSAD